MSNSKLEREFLGFWKILKGPELTTEYRFHAKRRWTFDFAFPEKKIAMEVEGGTFSRGRHVRGVGYANDCIKYNAATVLGWQVYRFTSDMLKKDPYGHLKPIIELINSTR